MATTDARPGFRLPWTSDQRPQTDPPTDEIDAASPATDEAPAGEATSVTAEPVADDATVAAVTDDAPDTEIPTGGDHPMPEPAATMQAPAAPALKPAARRPNKFLADLTRAMQAAAEAAREETLSRLQADAKAHIELIHEQSATDAAELRRRADDDVAAIREWSKAEIARIREETDQKISERKGRLEHEIDDHAARIEGRIEAVQGRVGVFETEMAEFFEQLLTEDDPTRFAALAENLPEPPPFNNLDDEAWSAQAAAPEAEVVGENTLIGDREPVAEPAEALITDAEAETVVGTAEADAEMTDPEEAMAAIQAAAEAAALAESAAAETAVELPDDAPVDDSASLDPRLSALGLGDFAAAEAEAAVAAGAETEVEEIPVIADDALAARLAGLVPDTDDPGATLAPETQQTRVVVTGLVSVASIASFKRHLGRLPGVQSVGVSSGPDGEFVFAVTHGAEVALRDAVTTLPGFQARVTGATDTTIEVTAHDPEAEA